VEDVWRFLATRGCGRLSLMVAAAEMKEGRLRPLQAAVLLKAGG
jgi:hypothetical protein